MKIEINLDNDFERQVIRLKEKYGEEIARINGFSDEQLDYTEFIDAFVDSDNVANATIDPNANVGSKDIRSLLDEMSKPHMKLLSFNKIYYEHKKKYGKKAANRWLEDEWTGALYMHDASSASFYSYCFSGETKILTKEGIKRLDELVGKNIKTLNINGGWEDSTVQTFGKRSLMKLVLERYGVTKTFYTTSNHRWFVWNDGKKGKIVYETKDLAKGMKIPFVTGKATYYTVEPSPFGIAHGFYIGDGDKGKFPRANFCGDKVALIPYFTPANVSGTEKELTTYGIPNYFKELPPLTETSSYLYGFLSGYFAADGSVDEKGRCTISSTKKETLEFVQNILCVLGMPVNEIRSQERVSNLTGELGTVYILSLTSEYLKPDFFIRPQHKERFKINDDKKNRSWTVVSVEGTTRTEETYCVVAPETQSFVLEGNVLTHNCYAYELQPLAERGLYFLPKSNTNPPMHLTTFMAHLREFIVWVSNRSAGACALPGFFVYTWYFWHKDVENGYYLKDPEYYRRQLFQQFIFEVNQIHTRITQSAYTNLIIMDREYITEIFGDRTFPDGTYVIDHVDDIVEHQKVYMETEKQIREEVFHTFPVYTYSLLHQNGAFVDEEFARWCSDNNIRWYDSNFYVGDSVTNLASCCRMLNNISKQKQFQSSIGGSLVEIGSVKVSTINLMRIAIESGGDKKKFIKILRDRVDENMKILDTVRHIIQRNIEKGLLPNYSYGVINLDKQTTTNGLTAMYEAIREMGMIETDELGNVSYTQEGIEFACEIMDTVNDMQDNAGYEYNVSLEIVPAESANVKLCKKDNIIYGRDTDFIYSNQWTSLMAKCDIEQRIKLSSILDRKAGGGQILHANLDGAQLTKDQAWELLNHIADSGVIYFAFNPKLSLCEKKHTFYGDRCPTCGGPKTDEASRIVGYLVPTSTYSSARKDEYLAREWYKVEGDGIL